MRLFHLHFFTNHLAADEAHLSTEMGFTRAGVFGLDGPLPVDADLAARDGPRLRLVELHRGGVNLVLMPGKDDLPRLEHFGWIVSAAEHARILAAAEAAGWGVQVKPARTFLAPSLGFRIELRIEEEGSQRFAAGALSSVRLRHMDAASVAAELSAVLGLSLESDGAAHTLRDEGATLSFEPGSPLFARAKIAGGDEERSLTFAPR